MTKPVISGSIVSGNDSWDFDTVEEWLAEYGNNPDGAGINAYEVFGTGQQFRFSWTRRTGAWSEEVGSSLTVRGPDRPTIERYFDVFESASAPTKVPLTLFIGHGRSPLWRELADLLEQRFDVETVTFDYAERAGHDVRGTLQEMLDEATFAVLVLTAEDETRDGTLRARQNVVHEVGLFQGRLGFDKAVVLLEEGCEEFTNLAGTLHVPFPSGRIEEAVGRVVAVLRREFGPI